MKTDTLFMRFLGIFLIMAGLSLNSAADAYGQASLDNRRAGKSKELEGVIAFIRDKYSKLDSWEVDTQDMDRSLLLGTGRFHFKRPLKIKWEEYDLTGQLDSVWTVNSDGDSLFYSPKSKTLDRWRYKGKETKLGVRSLLIGIFKSGTKIEFLGTRRIDGESVYVVEVADKTSDNPNLWDINRGYFSQRTGLLVRLDFLDQLGGIRSETVFRNFKLNVPIDDAIFKFSPPPQTEIIDQ